MRFFLLLAFAFIPFSMFAEDEGPAISISSPDTATTFAFGTIKNHTLVWSHDVLIARITFSDEEQTMTTATEDQHEFRLPGITLDAAKGIFYARSAKGELIPVAHFKKTLFIKSIETMPNARVRIIHPRGVVTVVLEAISPDDPAMHAPKGDPDATHPVDPGSILR